MKGMNNIAEYRIKYYAPISKPIFFSLQEKMLTFVIAKIGKHAFFEAIIGMPMEIKNDFSDRFLPSKKATD
ncbi:MAG: hypothetical protein IJE15_10910 [Bacteroidaceae bacterium]|nr:hypothetical protein [Bacteroidaceae bacterium]